MTEDHYLTILISLVLITKQGYTGRQLNRRANECNCIMFVQNAGFIEKLLKESVYSQKIHHS